MTLLHVGAQHSNYSTIIIDTQRSVCVEAQSRSTDQSILDLDLDLNLNLNLNLNLDLDLDLDLNLNLNLNLDMTQLCVHQK
ncbi:hypothetical protein ABVT39_007549 [Epinephelus coioides]